MRASSLPIRCRFCSAPLHYWREASCTIPENLHIPHFHRKSGRAQTGSGFGECDSANPQDTQLGAMSTSESFQHLVLCFTDRGGTVACFLHTTSRSAQEELDDTSGRLRRSRCYHRGIPRHLERQRRTLG